MKFRPVVAMVAIVSAAALVLSGCSATADDGTNDGAPRGGTLTLGTSIDMKTFDPSQADPGHDLQYYQAVYDSLLRREPDGTLVPMLATKWSYNDDHTVLTLSIRKGVTFSDGTDLDANAVKANLDGFPVANGPAAATFSSVESVEAPDATTVVITLKQPDPAFLAHLGTETGFIASPTAISAGNLATEPVGSGPYTLDAADTVAGSVYTFVARDGYWDPSLQVYDKVVLKPIPDPTAILNALLSGQVNGALLSPTTMAQATNAGMTETRFSVDWNGLLILDRNGTRVPALADVRVRQAINYAIDKDAIVKAVNHDVGEVTNQIFGTHTTAYVKSLDNRYPFDPEKAKSLMADAGYSGGFTVTMPIVAGLFPEALTAAIAQNLGDIGITVEWDTIAINDFISSILQGKYSMVWFQLAQRDTWTSSKQLLTPDAGYNPFKVADPKVESLLTDIQTGSDSDAASAAQELGTYIVEQAWFAPFQRPGAVYFTDKTTSVVAQATQAVPSLYNYAPKK
jgi:peptide/nickel transport system substrate-binding protein